MAGKTIDKKEYTNSKEKNGQLAIKENYIFQNDFLFYSKHPKNLNLGEVKMENI